MPLTEINEKTREDLEKAKRIIKIEVYRDARELYEVESSKYDFVQPKQIFD